MGADLLASLHPHNNNRITQSLPRFTVKKKATPKNCNAVEKTKMAELAFLTFPVGFWIPIILFPISNQLGPGKFCQIFVTFLEKPELYRTACK